MTKTRLTTQALDDLERHSTWCIDYTPDVFTFTDGRLPITKRSGNDGRALCVKCEKSRLSHLIRDVIDALRTEREARETAERERDARAQQVEALRQELPSCDGCGHPAVDHEGHPLAVVDKGACEQFESTSDRLTAELEAAQQDAARLREALDTIASPGSIEDYGNGWAVELARRAMKGGQS
jgi:hypothetical protein